MTLKYVYTFVLNNSGLLKVNSYETTRQYLGATELNTAGRRAEI